MISTPDEFVMMVSVRVSEPWTGEFHHLVLVKITAVDAWFLLPRKA
jgi:hypothetical protein